ncbi:MAG: hypothetical protein IPG76_11545 [Acidobacteria bacterium]|nr:hypothetical protein [Acidobacteriota bacterium]
MPVLAMPTEMESVIVTQTKTVDEKPVAALKTAPITVVKPTGEEVEVAQVITTPPAQSMPEKQMATEDTTRSASRLPQTASTLPLLGLIGLLSLCAGLALSLISRRTV